MKNGALMVGLPPRRSRRRLLLAGTALMGSMSFGLAACGGQSGGTIKISVGAGPPGTIVQLSGDAGAGCVVDKNWFGFQFQPFGRGSSGPATEMTTPVQANGAWSASFAIPAFLGGSSKRGPGARTTVGRYQFTAPNCTGSKVASVPFRVENGSAFSMGRYVAIATTTDGLGYWLVQANGTVSAFGDAHSYGSLAPGKTSSAAPIVGIARTLVGRGYWLVNSVGNVYHFGDALAYGSLSGSQGAHGPVVGIATTSDGKGYWLLAADGHVSGFGDGHAYGMPNDYLSPYDAIGTRPAGGYVVTAADDGGAYLFPGGALSGGGGGPGAAQSATLVGTAITPSGNGAWEAGTDGGVITTGDAVYHGSVPGNGVTLKVPVTAMAALPSGLGYWLLGATGKVFAFGAATVYGSLSAPSASCGGHSGQGHSPRRLRHTSYLTPQARAVRCRPGSTGLCWR